MTVFVATGFVMGFAIGFLGGTTFLVREDVVVVEIFGFTFSFVIGLALVFGILVVGGGLERGRGRRDGGWGAMSVYFVWECDVGVASRKGWKGKGGRVGSLKEKGSEEYNLPTLEDLTRGIQSFLVIHVPFDSTFYALRKIKRFDD